MVALIAALGVAVTVLLSESLHVWRIKRIAPLAFGPRRRASWLGWFAPAIRLVGWSAITWSLVTLWGLPPKVHRQTEISPEDYQHIFLVLDVSPSMRLQDAGSNGTLSRTQRAREVLESMFQRVDLQQYKFSVVAVYNGVKPVVIDTTDIEVVRNTLSDLPMYQAFPAGKTDLFAGLAEAAKLTRDWRPNSTMVLVISDGDSVPPVGLPEMPASVRNVTLIGVGDPVTGKFIDGQQSRQEVSTLRQLALRLGGEYHNGNEHQLSSSLINEITEAGEASALEKLTLREYALIILGVGTAMIALLPVLLTYFGAGLSWSRATLNRGQAGWSDLRRSSSAGG